MKNYVKQRIVDAVTIGALAQNALAADDLGTALEEEGRISSLDGIWTIRGGTNTEGPIVFGVAHPDYTAAEIEACLESQNTGPNSRIESEVARRLVREIGVILDVVGDPSFNDGRPVKTKLNWPVGEGMTPVKGWVLNIGTGQMTTGALLLFVGKANLFMD